MAMKPCMHADCDQRAVIIIEDVYEQELQWTVLCDIIIYHAIYMHGVKHGVFSPFFILQ